MSSSAPIAMFPFGHCADRRERWLVDRNRFVIGCKSPACNPRGSRLGSPGCFSQSRTGSDWVDPDFGCGSYAAAAPVLKSVIATTKGE
jgi:hypothetical protein